MVSSLSIESPRRTSTPISNKISGSQPYSSTVPNQDKEFRLRLAEETKGLFIGPMPYQIFLDRFLPHASDSEPCPAAEGIFSQVAKKRNEAEMYKPFVRIGNYSDMGTVFTHCP
jgi:hypothetical protein